MKLRLDALPGWNAPVVDEARMTEMLLLAGWIHEPDRERSRRHIATVLDELVAAGLPTASDGHGKRCVDAYQTINAIRWAGLADGYPVWRDRFVHTARITASSFAITSTPRRFAIRIRRTIAARDARATVRVPIPLDGNGQTDIEVDSPEPLRRGDGWVEAVVEAAGAPTASLEVTIRVTVTPSCPDFEAAPIRIDAVDRADAELYLRPREGLVVVTPAIAALARDLAHGARTPWEIIERLWTFAFRHLWIGPIYHRTLSVDDPLAHVLSTRWSDCYVASALVTALCRAVGIPARIVGGYFLYASSPTNHYWCEALLPPHGWVPLDLACWEMAAGDVDEPWARRFLGRIDYRIVTERFPRQFTGRRSSSAGEVVILQAPGERGATVSVFGLDPHTLVYEDRVEVVS
jgi:transglutaminase-like putative cysteine protease